MRTQIEIKRIIGQLNKKAKEHKRKIDIIKKIKYLIKADISKKVKKSNEDQKFN